MKRSGLAAVWFALVALSLPASGAARASLSPAAPTSLDAPSGVYYEIFVRSFYDSNGDGIGDLAGITAKLDYLKALGVSGIWLTPINPSPSYHGYDVTDYYAINPQFGTMADFKRLLHEAHRRGIKVLMDLVINHSSDRNPWFRKALNPRSPFHDWYVWAGPHTDLQAVSATGGPAWHARDGEHYLGVFSAQMPDFNYDNPTVRREMIKIGRFWLHQGVDGFRLDAAKHIYDDLASDNDRPQIVAENIAWWRQFHDAMKKSDPKVFLVGEVSAGQEIELAPYYAALNSVFDFPLAAELIGSARAEYSADLGCRVHRALARFRKYAHGLATDTPFLSNHDQERVINQLHGNADHMRMAAAMLLTLPGRPFLYYGEEIGMRGTKPDPEIREPMRWERSTRARGETTWESDKMNTAPQISVAAERNDPDSLLNFYRRLIHWRAQLPALRDGDIAADPADQGSIAAYVRADRAQRLLVVHNLSGTARRVQLLVGAWRTVIRSTRRGVSLTDRTLTMPAYSTAIVR